MILLNQNIQTFLVVVELSSITAAAQRLKLTQTGITQRIKSLERETQLTLFTRSRTGMKLTPEGQSFLRYCKDARVLEERLVLDLGKAGHGHEIQLTLVGPANLIGGRVAYQCQHVFAKWPNLNFIFSIDSYANRLRRLKQGLADIAILQEHEVSPELDSKVLKPIENVLVCTTKWKGRPLKEIIETERLYAYNSDDTMGIDYLKQFNLFRHLRRARLYANEDQVLQNQISLGIGFGMLPRELAQPLIDSNKIMILNGNNSLKVKMALAWYHREEMPDYFKEIIHSIS